MQPGHTESVEDKFCTTKEVEAGGEYGLRGEGGSLIVWCASVSFVVRYAPTVWCALGVFDLTCTSWRVCLDFMLYAGCKLCVLALLCSDVYSVFRTSELYHTVIIGCGSVRFFFRYILFSCAFFVALAELNPLLETIDK